MLFLEILVDVVLLSSLFCLWCVSDLALIRASPPADGGRGTLRDPEARVGGSEPGSGGYPGVGVPRVSLGGVRVVLFLGWAAEGG